MEYQNRASSVLSPEILDAVDLHIEAIYETERPQKVAREMAKAKLSSSQIRGLENLILSTRRFSEILNYIKNQAGKGSGGKWSPVVDELLSQLEALEKTAKEIGNNDPAVTLHVKMRLARGWIKQITAHYLFTVAIEKGQKDAG